MYIVERGLYYHEVWKGGEGGSLICGTMPRNVQDLDYLHFQEKVDVVVNVGSRLTHPKPTHLPLIYPLRVELYHRPGKAQNVLEVD